MMSGALLEVLQMLLLVSVQVLDKYLFNICILKKHLNALDLS
jgi:hypothetical protein